VTVAIILNETNSQFADHAMFQIKICGVTSAADATMAVEAGADAIGLNFYPASPRCLTLEVARHICTAIGSSAAKVGVFVNATAEEVFKTASTLQLDCVQIHGDEPPAYLSELTGLRIIRAFRCRDDGLAPVHAYITECHAPLAAVLIDAYSPEAYGGTGHVVDWNMLAPYAGTIEGVPLILAGGLQAENIARAIETSRCAAVDTASGVESSPGRKDAAASAAFVAQARLAFDGRGGFANA
jgi:phosphoribosylanthranilate isomerase